MAKTKATTAKKQVSKADLLVAFLKDNDVIVADWQLEMLTRWIEGSESIDLKGTSDYDQDKWLEFFRTKTTAGDLIDSIDELKYRINSDGYAALMRWMEIFDSPSKMDKLRKANLEKQRENSILDLAVGDDDEAFYKALIIENVTQLNSSSTSQQEVARLSQNINIYRKELKDVLSRKPKRGSVLEKILDAAEKKPAVKKTPARKKPVSKKKPVVKKPKVKVKTNAA